MAVEGYGGDPRSRDRARRGLPELSYEDEAQGIVEYFMAHGKFEDQAAALALLGPDLVRSLISNQIGQAASLANSSASYNSRLGSLADAEAYTRDKFALDKEGRLAEQGVQGDKLSRSLGYRGIMGDGGIQRQLQRDLSEGHSRSLQGDRLGFEKQMKDFARSRSDGARNYDYSRNASIRKYQDEQDLSSFLSQSR